MKDKVIIDINPQCVNDTELDAAIERTLKLHENLKNWKECRKGVFRCPWCSDRAAWHAEGKAYGCQNTACPVRSFRLAPKRNDVDPPHTAWSYDSIPSTAEFFDRVGQLHETRGKTEYQVDIVDEESSSSESE